MKDEEWDEVIRINLEATFRLMRAAVKGMMRRRYGRIISIGSVVGTTGNPGQGNYAASKAGLIGMSKALGAEVASRGVTVNVIAPGFIESPMTDGLNDKQREAILRPQQMAQLLGHRERHLVNRSIAVKLPDRSELFDINNHHRLAVGWPAVSMLVSAARGCPLIHRSKVLPQHRKVLAWKEV